MEFFELIDYLYNETVNGDIEWFRYNDYGHVCTRNKNIIISPTHMDIFGEHYNYRDLSDESIEKLRYMINQVKNIQVVSDRIKKLVMTQEL